MEGDQIADEVICLCGLYIQHSLIVQGLSLDHFPVMKAYAEEEEVHHLAQGKLDWLVVANSLLVPHQVKGGTEQIGQVNDNKMS